MNLSKIAWSLCCGALALLASAGVAQAENVAFAQLNQDFDGFGAELTDALEDAGHDVAGARWLTSELEDAGCEPGLIERDPSCLLEVCHAERLDVVIVGDVIGGASPDTIQLRVLDGVTGSLVGRVTVPLDDGSIGRGALDDAVDDLDALFTDAGWGQVTSFGEQSDDDRRNDDRGGRDDRTNDNAAAPAYRHDIIRYALVIEFASRNLDLVAPSDVPEDTQRVQYSASMYPGMGLDLELYPLAAFMDNAAGGIGFYFENSRHNVVTVTAFDLGGQTGTYEIPTRHNVTGMGLRFEWSPIPEFMVAPFVGRRSLVFDLGFNDQYNSSFYNSWEAGMDLAYYALTELSIRAMLSIRPGVDLGSTVAPYGVTATSSALTFGFGARYRFDFGFFADIGLTFERYQSTFNSETGVPTATSTDAFQTFALSLGYAY